MIIDIVQFAFIRSDFGVDTRSTPASMVVPVGGANFILIHDASAARMETTSSRITIREIVDSKELDREISRIRFIGLSLGNSFARKLIEFLVGEYGMLTQKKGKLFKITAGRGGGFAEVFAIDKRTNARLKLNVYILQRQEFSVDFRFPFALDAAGQRHRLSKLPLSHADAWLDEANVIFGPQVNIFFKLAAASEPFINQPITTVTSSHWDLLKKLANPDPKTITVFMAEFLLTNDKDHPFGMSLRNKSRVILLQDRDSEDELAKTLAHEFGHTVSDMKGFDVGHPGGKGDLMVSYSRFEGVRMAAKLISVLGKQ